MFDYYASLHAGRRLQAAHAARNEARSYALYQGVKAIARPLVKAIEWVADFRRETERRRQARETTRVLDQLSDRNLADIGISRHEIGHLSLAASYGAGTTVAEIRESMDDHEASRPATHETETTNTQSTSVAQQVAPRSWNSQRRSRRQLTKRTRRHVFTPRPDHQTACCG